MHLSRALSRSVIGMAVAIAAGLLAAPGAGARIVPAAAHAAPRGLPLHLYDASFCSTTVGWAVGAQAP